MRTDAVDWTLFWRLLSHVPERIHHDVRTEDYASDQCSDDQCREGSIPESSLDSIPEDVLLEVLLPAFYTRISKRSAWVSWIRDWLIMLLRDQGDATTQSLLGAAHGGRSFCLI